VVVAEQAVLKTRAGFVERRDLCAVGDEDIGPAVVIVVEDRDAGGHGLDLVPVACGAVSTTMSSGLAKATGKGEAPPVVGGAAFARARRTRLNSGLGPASTNTARLSRPRPQ
jgi:hypothetical protein